MTRTRSAVVRTMAAFGLAAAIVAAPHRGIGDPLSFSVPISVTDFNPDAAANSGLAGGRVHHLASNAERTRFYAASEWGGLFRSDDHGNKWTRLDAYEHTASWDVEVDWNDSQVVYATALYDGRVKTQGAIAVSRDGGASWTHPASAIPSQECSASLREQFSAFGISSDYYHAGTVWIGTRCGVAKSEDFGDSWTFFHPFPDKPDEDEIWDVLVHNDIVDVVGANGHARSTDGGVSWKHATGNPLPASSAGSITVSPHEDYVLFATVNSLFYESDDGGASWSALGMKSPAKTTQARIPFVKAERQSAKTYELWFGDVELYKTPCKTAKNPKPGGPPRCDYSMWSGPLDAGAHTDVGDLLFENALEAACPMLFANDGGVYRNTKTTSPDCLFPSWTKPARFPRATWIRSVAMANDPATSQPGLLIGTQDNGGLIASHPAIGKPEWTGYLGGDVASILAGSHRVVVQAFDAAHLAVVTPALQYHHSPLLPGSITLNHGNVVAEYEPDRYVVATGSGVFVTSDIDVDKPNWSPLGQKPYPTSAFVSIRVSRANDIEPVQFFVQASSSVGASANETFTSDSIWRYSGDKPGGVWTKIKTPTAGGGRGGPGGFSVVDVHPFKPGTIVASFVPPLGPPQMVRTTDGGGHWSPLPDLDALMTGNGVFRYGNQFGPKQHHVLTGYLQPTLIAFDPLDPSIVVAGGSDSGVFLSTDTGATWTKVRNPESLSATPDIPRPQVAAFEHPFTSFVSTTAYIYVGTMGRGMFRVSAKVAKFRNPCLSGPNACFPITKEPPLGFLARPIGPQAALTSPLGDFCPAGAGACEACARGDCAQYYNLFLDGFDAANWDLELFDERGAPVTHGLLRTDAGVVISLKSAADIFTRYRVVFAQRSGARNIETRFVVRLQAADRPYAARSLDDMVF